MSESREIPKFTVDLSQAPKTRYDHIIPHFKTAVDSCDLPSLFYDLLNELAGRFAGKILAAVSPLIMRRVHSQEEKAELTGISKAIDIPMHILVAFNVLLDLLLGCTSGGVRTLDPDSGGKATRMLHFRTLDWGMDQLRQIIVELDFVRTPGGPVIATTVGYLGYVGVLTGVRQGLSLSLNFRPYHATETLRQRLSYRCNQAMVVLGYRKSISSSLRHILLDDSTIQERQSGEVNEMDNVSPDSQNQYVQKVLTELSTSNSTAAYLILCQPDRVFVIEKDHRSASIRESDTFLTAYNHDVKDEDNPAHLQQAAAELAEGDDAIGMADLVAYSLERKHDLDDLWRKRVRACKRRYKQRNDVVTSSDVVKFLQNDMIVNEETHYAVIMDPKEGKVTWRRAYEYVSESEGWNTEEN
ncbi:beta subunit of N-acylethanolamine-hydrolyzing acid amidase-domain-containing protein [Fusarium redolens]|uniref:ceramidase n=1 Tax=Fusarium redolens TaxID=48865 RepID=A0A9P9HKU3_FUSRE|nr:beta subunit of N-acylethanolamine-hydrolyzing acid amidase-domain-containing protein [Fusarium redolens]KAH7259444.1 beta subunit of N-acylethanolamine-hydrolyzing acid amidase-domain-containing protein [Fusarium redolens]